MMTIGHANIGDWTGGDFDRARRKAFARRVLARLAGNRNRLLSFEEAAGAAGSPTYLGLRAVETRSIIGSVGRYRDFDRAFLPTRSTLRERWKRVNRAFRRSERLPPVRLSKVGDAYFVLDGNHRVSVARFHGADWIDAEVTEFRDARGNDRQRERGNRMSLEQNKRTIRRIYDELRTAGHGRDPLVEQREKGT